MEKQEIFKDYFRLPLSRMYSKVFTWDSEMAFDFPLKMLYPFSPSLTDEDKDNIVSIINGEKSSKKLDLEGKFLKYIPENTTIYLFDKGIAVPFIIVRGWGSLTGVGGHRLDSEKASEIQNSFGEWIVEKLTEN